MRTIGTTERRVIGALLVSSILPLLAAIVLANFGIRRATELTRDPSLRRQLERSAELHTELASARRFAMAMEVASMAASASARGASESAERRDMRKLLESMLHEHPMVLSLTVVDATGAATERAAREPRRDERLEPTHVERAPLLTASGSRLEAVFAVDRESLDESTSPAAVNALLEALDGSAAALDRQHATAFAALLALSVLFAAAAGVWASRPLAETIFALLGATRAVASGELTARVKEDHRGELYELAVAFNRMVAHLEKNRDRIEYLKRVGQWRTVARRLAHEIKNPLTPIVLAVDECFQQYRGEDPRFRSLLTTMRDIVTEEVESLRTLVGEFAAFARLPRPNLRPDDLAEFLRASWPRFEREDLPAASGRSIHLELDCDGGAMPTALDRTLFHRALVNLVGNAKQAAASVARQEACTIRVTARRLEGWCDVTIDDDGPGIPDVLKAAVFDPYVTTKREGTGLGLSIVQKIVIDHGGTVEVGDNPSGGARFVIRLPVTGTVESLAAIERSRASAWSTTGSHPGLA